AGPVGRFVKATPPRYNGPSARRGRGTRPTTDRRPVAPRLGRRPRGGRGGPLADLRRSIRPASPTDPRINQHMSLVDVDSDPTREGAEPRRLRYSFWAGALTIRGSVSPRVYPDVLAFGALAAAIVVAGEVSERRFGVSLSVPVGPYQALGAVLGLLLVLRTNAGSDRWWEARKLWGGIVNQSRNLASIALAFGPEDLAWRGRLIRWAAAFPHATRGHLRGQRDVPEVFELLGPDEARRLAAADHVPALVA